MMSPDTYEKGETTDYTDYADFFSLCPLYYNVSISCSYSRK